jgi:hypothetical protein
LCGGDLHLLRVFFCASKGAPGLASHLTDRDRRIAWDRFEFRVLTTSQITRLYFTGTRTAAARLDVLYRLRALDRFRPSLPMGQGTAPYHWILDEAGALIVADHLDIERAKLGWQHSIAASIAHSQKLPHHVEVNEFFTRLAVEANVAGGALSEWYGERTCHHLFSGYLVADGYGVSISRAAGLCTSWSSWTEAPRQPGGYARRPGHTRPSCLPAP